MTQTFLFILEGTEHERNWGQRPDGFVLLRSEAAADAWLETYNAGLPAIPPHEYTTYAKLGYHPVTAAVAAELDASERGVVHKQRKSEFMMVIT